MITDAEDVDERAGEVGAVGVKAVEGDAHAGLERGDEAVGGQGDGAEGDEQDALVLLDAEWCANALGRIEAKNRG